ncbi:MAG TPA: FKBP-type peptidyl-prolyl cis-trans isomerase [Candidatus Deferrimicrobiaceae bacterium]|jgi:FKBP-type peptidyl-prolyl cis-trans isomerase|nr:FKBP-type peptidyl-prolyl cis-trans isomerase [Candidatus Deferrimicrobiaceae bacterium]
MTKYVAAVFLVFALTVFAPTAVFALAQSAARKSTAPNTTAPSKVTGPGVTTSSGLVYWEIRVGNGEVAKEGSRVRVHYTGWLTNGKKFDSSVDAGKPFDFTIGNGEVIKGWEEGVAGMRVGGKRQLRIPPDLAYGTDGTPDGSIPPNATLIFDVQLLGVQ